MSRGGFLGPGVPSKEPFPAPDAVGASFDAWPYWVRKGLPWWCALAVALAALVWF